MELFTGYIKPSSKPGRRLSVPPAKLCQKVSPTGAAPGWTLHLPHRALSERSRHSKRSPPCECRGGGLGIHRLFQMVVVVVVVAAHSSSLDSSESTNSNPPHPPPSVSSKLTIRSDHRAPQSINHSVYTGPNTT